MLFFSLLRTLFVNNISEKVHCALFLTVEFPAKEIKQSLLIKSGIILLNDSLFYRCYAKCNL